MGQSIGQFTSARFDSEALEPLHVAARGAGPFVKSVVSLPLGPEAVHVCSAGRCRRAEQTGAHGHPQLSHAPLVASGARLLRARPPTRALRLERLLRPPHLQRARCDLRTVSRTSNLK